MEKAGEGKTGKDVAMVTIHEKTARVFDTLGLGALLPASCVITEELNGAFELEMEHPYDEGGKWRRIERGRILYAPTPTGFQPFRIYKTAPSMESVKVNACHIFYDLLDNLCGDIVSFGTAAQAMEAVSAAMAYPMPVTLATDIEKSGRMTASKVNPVHVLLAEDENMESFVRTFGGELLRDHFSVTMKESIGADRDVVIRYGKNLVGLEVNEDESEVRTRVLAYGKNNIFLAVDSPHINDYLYPKIVTFTDESAQTTAQLRQKALELFNEDEIDLPKVNIKVDFVPLAKTEEYKDFAALEDVRLGDTVTVINTRMGFSKRAKVISYQWDCLLGQYTQVELGDFMGTIADSITDGENSYKFAVEASLEAKNVINIISGRIAITETSFYVAIDTADYLTSERLFRFGENGLQFTEKGIEAKQDEWKTLITPNGEIVIEN